MEDRGFGHGSGWVTVGVLAGICQARWRGQDFGEFEVDDAEAAEFVRVGDVAGFGVEVAHAVFPFEFGEEFVGLFLGDLGGEFAAIGGDEVEFLRVFFEQSGDVGAAALFEHLEHGDFGGVAFVRIGAAEAFVDVAVEIDPHLGADAVFEGIDGHGVVRATKPGRGASVTAFVHRMADENGGANFPENVRLPARACDGMQRACPLLPKIPPSS